MSLNPAKFPRPPALERITRHLLIKWPGPSGPTIAETRAGYWVLETWHPPTYYIPPGDMQASLSKLPRRTYCEWKGPATYFSITAPGGERVDNKIWTYEAPTPGFKDIKDYLCFYATEEWECYVDGEKVEPQPGDFYGGWMTSDVLRESVKGAPGTTHW